ncbi:MAG: hypothetical protein Q9191_000221 [Dirinaria sp. TL-2023a]
MTEDEASTQEILNQVLKDDALDDSYILRISIYFASERNEHGFLNEGQHRRISTHKGTMNLDDVLRGEVLREYKSNKSDAMKKGKEDRDEDTLVDAAPGPRDVKLTSVKKMLSGPKERKKGGEMLVMSKAPCSIDHDNLLMDTEVSESQKIRDDLRRLVRGYLHVGLSLLEMNYQSNQ